MEFVRSGKVARKLVRNRYMYVFKRDLAGEVTSWECELRRRGQCKAGVKLEEINEINDHIPSPPILRRQKLR